MWAASALDSARTSAELRRARELRDFYDSVDYLLDIHSMSDPCPPLMLAGTRRKGVELARGAGLSGIRRHRSGPQRRAGGCATTRASTIPADPRTALLIECGQHWSDESAAVAMQCALRFLRHFDAADPDFIARHLDLEVNPGATRRSSSK